MSDIVFHEKSSQQIEAFLAKPSHALLLVAPVGSGKAIVARQMAADILSIKRDSVEQYPYIRLIRPEAGKNLGIEPIRELEHFLSLKVPGERSTDRIVIIEESHLLTLEAQNALLKTLEEPPTSTVLILTAAKDQSLLPTIRSRVQRVELLRPSNAALKTHFEAQSYTSKDIQRAYTISGGLPGLMQALLEQTGHPLLQATEKARQLLQMSTYERLLLVDELVKQRQLAQDTLFILGHMAEISLTTAKGKTALRWQKILEGSYFASEALAGSAQPKLVLTNLMLKLA